MHKFFKAPFEIFLASYSKENLLQISPKMSRRASVYTYVEQNSKVSACVSNCVVPRCSVAFILQYSVV
jgi:hypothetical protein